jgi:hypothetical protein
MQSKDSTLPSQLKSCGSRSQYPSVIREGVQNHVQDLQSRVNLSQ